MNRLLVLSLFCVSSVFASDASHWYFQHNEEGVAIGGYDVVAYFNQKKAVEGKPDLKLGHHGLTYHFSNKENLEQFKAAPEKWLPQYGGWCAFAMGVDQEKFGFAQQRFRSDPTSFKLINGKLFLFANLPNFNAADVWSKEDQDTMVTRADRFWRSRLELGAKIGALPEGMNPSAPMETAQFDFIMGEWRSDVFWMNDMKKKTYAAGIPGYWSAAYSNNGYAVTDEWRSVQGNGPTLPTYRSYVPYSKSWVMTFIGPNQRRDLTWLMEGKFNDSGEMHAEFEGSDRTGKFMARVHFTEIKADSFLWSSDRSYDGGKTWIEKFGYARVLRIKDGGAKMDAATQGSSKSE